MAAATHFELERHTLGNGLRVVLHREPRIPLVTLNLWYHVGSKNERPGQTGFAHLFEHMLFQGSAHVPTHGHFQLVQEVGGSANGSTFYDRTNYYETVPSHHLERALWLEADRMGYLLPAMTQAKLDNQREVVINERKQRVDNQPYGRAHEALFEALYGADGHPYRWPVIGYVEDLRQASLEMVHEFSTTFYVPNNAVLTLAGDFEPDQAMALVEKHFGGIPGGAPVVQPRPALPLIESERRTVLPDTVKLPRVYMAWHLPGFGNRAWYAADLLSGALGGAKSSPVYEDVVYNRRLAQDVTFYVSSTEAAAILMVVGTARPEVPIDVLEEALVEHVERAAAAPLPARHLDRARHRLLAGHYAEVQKIERRADLFSEFTTFFDAPERVATEIERYREVEAGEIQALAATYLGRERRAVVTVLPSAGAPAGTGAA